MEQKKKPAVRRADDRRVSHELDVTTLAQVKGGTNAERIRDALRFIPVGGHDQRVRVAFMLKSELGEAGRDLWDEWRGDRGNDEADSVWQSASETGTLKIGTLFHEAKLNGWQDHGRSQVLTKEQQAERKRIEAERDEQEKAQIAIKRADTAKKAKAIWNAATQAKADHPYLLRKQIPPVETLREIEAVKAAEILGYTPKSDNQPLSGRLLVVPVKQGRDLSTLELIDEAGRKAALAGRGSKEGGHWATERLPDETSNGLTLLIGEGVATVLSASVASEHLGIAALSSANLLKVSQAMRALYPEATLVILADLVKKTGEPDPGAINAALAVSGFLALPDFGDGRAADSKDFNNMSVQCGHEAVKRAIANAKEVSKGGLQPSANDALASDLKPNGWPEPQPLLAKIEPEVYPLNALPDTIRAAVEEVQGFTKAPTALVASSALAALSLTIQAHADVKRAEKLHGPSGLYMLTIADSGERKSTCDSFFTKAIREHEKERAELAKPDLKNHKADIEAWEAKRGGIKEKIRQQAKTSKSTGEYEDALRNLEHNEPEPPRVPRLLYTDATPEALAYGLVKNWPSGGVFSSEAGLVFGSHGMGKDSAMRHMSLLNVLWDGGDLTIDRRTAESFTVSGARLTVGLQVQEATLRSFFDRSGELARGCGFLARFLVAWPESTQGERLFTEPPENWPAMAVFNSRISTILNQSAAIDENGALRPVMLDLAPEAKVEWVGYHDAIERGLRSGGELYDVRDVASKSADNAARLAALFHVFEGAAGPISAEAFKRASEIAAWHLNEARRFFGELALPAELADAVRLDSWLIEFCRREGMHIVSTREAQQFGPIRDRGRLTAALHELEELDRVRLSQEGRRRVITVNPALHGLKS